MLVSLNQLLNFMAILLLAGASTVMPDEPNHSLKEQVSDNPQRIITDSFQMTEPSVRVASADQSCDAEPCPRKRQRGIAMVSASVGGEVKAQFPDDVSKKKFLQPEKATWGVESASANRGVAATVVNMPKSSTLASANKSVPLPPAKALSAPIQVTNEKKVMGTWLWNTRLIKSSTIEILNFMSSRGVNTVYLQINRDIDPGYYKRFVREAGARGIAVHALGGRASWGLTSGREQIQTYLSWVKSYQKIAGPDEKFKGLHVDIEPYALPDWHINYAKYIPQWQKNVNYLVKEAAEMKLPIAADLPFWLSNYNVPGDKETLSLWMMRKFKTANIMSYRDSAEAVTDIAKKLLKEADFLGIQVTVSVETSQVPDGEYVSFYEERESFMIEHIRKLSGLLKKHPSSGGVAVSDYAGWKKLKK